MTTVAVLGLGAMGLPMALHLAASCTVRCYDPDPARRSAAGLQVSASAREAADGVDVVLLAVRDASQLDDALWGADGVAGVLPGGAAVLLTSTVGIAVVRAVAGRLGKPGCGWWMHRSRVGRSEPAGATSWSPSAPTTRPGPPPDRCCGRWPRR